MKRWRRENKDQVWAGLFLFVLLVCCLGVVFGAMDIHARNQQIRIAQMDQG